jgi:hypothetical protein
MQRMGGSTKVALSTSMWVLGHNIEQLGTREKFSMVVRLSDAMWMTALRVWTMEVVRGATEPLCFCE